MAPLDAPGRAALAEVVAGAARRGYPHKLAQELQGDADLRTPRALHPSFYGSYDWHSAVHCHWTLARLLESGLPEGSAATARAVLDDHLRPELLAQELAFFAGPAGRTAERPYGWSWLLRLHADVRRLAAGGGPLSPDAARWAAALDGLAGHLRAGMLAYLTGTLALPIRAGTHPNTAFSLRLLLEAARAAGDPELDEVVRAATERWFADDARLPWFAPPSGSDFLDPNLEEAALLAEVLPAGRLAAWLRRTGMEEAQAWAEPPRFREDGNDPGTVHLEGLVLSKAWCLHRLRRAVPAGDPLAGRLAAALDAHLERADRLDPADGFNRSHWIPTFAVYLDLHRAADG